MVTFKYVIVDSEFKRARNDNILTPAFEYPKQAQRYIEDYLGNSLTLRILRVKRNDTKRWVPWRKKKSI